MIAEEELVARVSNLGDEVLTDVPEMPEWAGPRICARIMSNGEPCVELLPADAPETQLYCDAHKNGKKRVIGAASEPLPPRIEPPKVPKVTKKDSDALKVEAGALAMLAFVPMIWGLTGDAVCSVAFNEQLPAIAHQLGELSRFHPALVKLFAPGDGTGEMYAWVGLVIAASPVIIAVLTHHRVVKGDLADRLTAAADAIDKLTKANAGS